MGNTQFLYNNKVFGSMSDNDKEVNITNSRIYRKLNVAINKVNYKFLSPKDKMIDDYEHSDGCAQYNRDMEIGCFCEDTDYDY